LLFPLLSPSVVTLQLGVTFPFALFRELAGGCKTTWQLGDSCLGQLIQSPGNAIPMEAVVFRYLRILLMVES
jgi:hypothetical protein